MCIGGKTADAHKREGRENGFIKSGMPQQFLSILWPTPLYGVGHITSRLREKEGAFTACFKTKYEQSRPEKDIFLSESS